MLGGGQRDQGNGKNIYQNCDESQNVLGRVSNVRSMTIDSLCTVVWRVCLSVLPVDQILQVPGERKVGMPF